MNGDSWRGLSWISHSNLDQGNMHGQGPSNASSSCRTMLIQYDVDINLMGVVHQMPNGADSCNNAAAACWVGESQYGSTESNTTPCPWHRDLDVPVPALLVGYFAFNDRSGVHMASCHSTGALLLDVGVGAVGLMV